MAPAGEGKIGGVIRASRGDGGKIVSVKVWLIAAGLVFTATMASAELFLVALTARTCIVALMR